MMENRNYNALDPFWSLQVAQKLVLSGLLCTVTEIPPLVPMSGIQRCVTKGHKLGTRLQWLVRAISLVRILITASAMS